MTNTNDNGVTRVSLYGLTPEEAVRALLAVDPDAPPVEPEDESEDEPNNHEAPAD